MVVTDHFTKYAQIFSFLRRLHSDQGQNFESKLTTCTVSNIKKSHTTPYHHMENGIAERFNSTLLNMLGILDPKKKDDWKSHVECPVHAYNCSKHNT